MHEIEIWLAEEYEKGSESSEACEKLFEELHTKLENWERVRVDEGCWPLARGRLGAKAIDMWYRQEAHWRRSHPDETVVWAYTGDDSESEADVEDDADELPVRKRRPRLARPHPRRSRSLTSPKRTNLIRKTRVMFHRMRKAPNR